MDLPVLLENLTEKEYYEYYCKIYCENGPINTFDGYPVWFYPDMFTHSFYRRSQASYTAPKACLDISRCERLDWIRAILMDGSLPAHKGWDSSKDRYDNTRRVTLVREEQYIVVIRRESASKWRFVTAYTLDREQYATQIDQSPLWEP